MIRSGSKNPICYIIAGPNGAGKTTFAMEYLPKIAGCCDFINADEIARGVSPLNASLGVVTASRLFLQMLAERIEQHTDFAFETTLSGRNYLSKIAAWRHMGWKVILIYLYVPSIDFSAARVKQRVLQGGHDIPIVDITRRYARSVGNLFTYLSICDETYCFDNSTPHITQIFSVINGKTVIEQSAIYNQMLEYNHDR